MSNELASVYLKKGQDRRLNQGHLWVYSNEIDTQKTSLKSFTAGEQVIVHSQTGKPLGIAYINPHSLISARFISRNTSVLLDRSLFVHRIKIALSLRERLFAKPYYRLIFGESDLLPGVVVDRFNDILVVQITTAGVEQQREALIEALEKVLKPRVILLRNDVKMRELEGLELYNEVIVGNLSGLTTIEENDTLFQVDIQKGQKTGWFYDHRMNRARVQQYAQGKRVLDLFSYVGAWGLAAAKAGASEVFCVDASEQALDWLDASAAMNDFNNITSIQGNVFDVLKHLRNEREKFDIVIVDPPAFIKRKKDYKEGLNAYRRVNQMAMQLCTRDAILVSASCSHHLPAETLVQQIQGAARHLDRFAQILEQGHQSPDHPIHPALPETAYIKSFLSRVTPT
ncbi:class I SAM-dependent rRNA methyltransferase [sulfur-oxidizing endosymbiont of Gigantopelta aegis]|uniref:class I SAM-dependent rRNA methyltransferase n=1 Tax=sulfur-oxidizing endosymbiont of Gigantopelta aegis TaxID=2794934 RepID=UPI0018DCE0AE|nr:class I SAM-dependent rRNA methyltransferase [sulfur-oxidizing endosymbiont of Gigantopelta aegis]